MYLNFGAIQVLTIGDRLVSGRLMNKGFLHVILGQDR